MVGLTSFSVQLLNWTCRGKNQLGKALSLESTIAAHFGDAIGSSSSGHGMEADAAAHLKHSILNADKSLTEKVGLKFFTFCIFREKKKLSVRSWVMLLLLPGISTKN